MDLHACAGHDRGSCHAGHGPSHAATRRFRRQTVHEREGKQRESLEGKDLRAIQLATYTAASVDGNTIVGYDLTTNTALASDITAAAKAAGATDTNLTVNGKNDPMVWVVKNLTDSRSDPWSGKLRNFCNSLAKQTNFAKQDGTAVSTLSQDKATMSTGNVLVPGIYAIVDRTPATTTLSSGTAIKTTASIMMMNGTAVNGVNQLRTAGGTTLTLGQVIYKVSNVESPDKKSTSAVPGKTAHPKR